MKSSNEKEAKHQLRYAKASAETARDYLKDLDGNQNSKNMANQEIEESRMHINAAMNQLDGDSRATGGKTEDDYTKNLGMVEVIFINPDYNYKTNVSGNTTEEQARDYFVGKSFNVAPYPKEVFKKVIDIKFHPKGTYASGGTIRKVRVNIPYKGEQYATVEEEIGDRIKTDMGEFDKSEIIHDIYVDKTKFMKTGGRTQDKHKTKVIFLYNEANEDLFAYFPDEVDHGIFKVAYSHVGQHSSVHPDYAKESRLATPEEYKDLKSELESIGYNLTVVDKRSMEQGGKIINQYENMTVDEIWNAWNPGQREQFLIDHADRIKEAAHIRGEELGSLWRFTDFTYDELPESIKQVELHHAINGQYAGGGKTTDKNEFYGIEVEKGQFISTMYDPKKIHNNVFYIGEPEKQRFANVDKYFWEQRTGGETVSGGKSVVVGVTASTRQLIDEFGEKYGIRRVTQEQWDNMTPPFNKKDFGGLLLAGAVGTALGAGLGYGYRDSITKSKEEAIAANKKRIDAAKARVEAQKKAFREKKESVKRGLIGRIERLEHGGQVGKGELVYVPHLNKSGVVMDAGNNLVRVKFANGELESFEYSEVEIVKDEDEYSSGGSMATGGKTNSSREKLQSDIDKLEKSIGNDLTSDENREKMKIAVKKKKSEIAEIDAREKAKEKEEAEEREKQESRDKVQKLLKKKSPNKSLYIDMDKSLKKKMRNALAHAGIPYESQTSGDTFRVYLSNQFQLDKAIVLYNERREKAGLEPVDKEEVSQVIKKRVASRKIAPAVKSRSAKSKLSQKVEKRRGNVKDKLQNEE